MEHKKWSPYTKAYGLSEVYTIEKAETREFALYLLTYGDKGSNKFAIQSWEKTVEFYASSEFSKNNSYWIKREDHIVGGVGMAPNEISDLFFIPPFEEQVFVMKLLKNLLLQWSNQNKNIYAHDIAAQEVECYEKLGFRLEKKRCWLMRPTAAFEIQWDNKFRIEIPQREKIEDMARFFYTTNLGGVDDSGEDIESHISAIRNKYFENYSNTGLFYKASTLLYDVETEEIVAVCLITNSEGWPLVFDIAVHPSYRKQGIATKMLKKALSVLKEEHKVLVLYVTQGNEAEILYHNLSFVRGVENAKLYIPKGRF